MPFDNNLYNQIVSDTRKIAEVQAHKYNTKPTEDTIQNIIQEVAIVVLNKINNPDKTGKIRELRAYTNRVITNHFTNYYRLQKKNETFLKELGWITNPVDEPFSPTPDEKETDYISAIDEYIRGHPKIFTPQNLLFWNMVKTRSYSVAEMMEQMGMTKRGAFIMAKTRLLKRIAPVRERIFFRDDF